MASVRLNGDTSGFIEISAPNVAGSTTITLPATSGGNFLVTDSNGDLNVDSGTLFVDASTDRVGIGTTSPSGKLTVRGGTTESNVIRITDGSNYTMELGRSLDDTGSFGYIGGTGNTGLTLGANNTEFVRIDTSGRLLVGRTSGPTSTVCITGRSDGESNTPFLRLDLNTGTPADGAGLGVLAFGSVSDTGENRAAQIVGLRDGGTWTANSSLPGRLMFSTTADGSTTPTERMRIGSLGTTQIASRPNNVTLQLRYAGSPDTGNDIQQVFRDAGINSGVLCCRIRSDGNLQNTNGSYTQISDAKLKENIVDANSQWDDIKGVRIRNWNFKEETGNLTHKQIGPIAQELEEVCPNLVFDTPDQDEEGNDLGTVTKGVNQSVLYMKAVKALQEAMERIETLETANASLEARLTALEGGN